MTAPSRPAHWPRRALRQVLGVGAGGIAVPVEIVWLPIAAIVRTPPERLLEWHRRRLADWLGANDTDTYLDRRPWAYLWRRAGLGLLGAVILLMVVFGTVEVVAGGITWLSGRPADGIEPDPFTVGYLVGFAAVLAFLAWQGLNGVAAAERRLATRLRGPDPDAPLRRRITELTDSRAAVVSAVDDERRRIERDLHDGVQQRLVALGMLLGRARRTDDPDRRGRLLDDAHRQSLDALTELRDVAWRVYPAALDDGGLAEAVETVGERSPIRVDRRVRTGPLPASVATAAYFVVSEAVTNAVKHSGADRVSVDIDDTSGRLRILVRDNGSGGADPSGRGLTGLARRAAAVDGILTVDSPPGGPTTIITELPCE